MRENDYDLTTQAGRIGYAIEQSGVARQTVADAAGVSKQAVGQWISGRTKNLKNENLFTVAEVTGFAAKWIVTGKGDPKPARSADARIAHVLQVMEQLPSYAIDEAVRNLDSVAELVRRAQANPADPEKVSNGN